ncbi:MAG: PrsW family glutamic-type intramembrane protease [Flavobacteriales bacterium]
MFVNIFIGEPTFNSSEEEELHYQIIQDYEGQEDFYHRAIFTDTFNIYYHFNFISAHFNREREVSKLLGANIGRSDDSILVFYDKFTYHSLLQAQDIGHFGKGLCYYKLANFEDAYKEFKEIKNRDLPYLHFMYGNLFQSNDSTKAKEEYEKEIANEAFIEGAYKGLAELHDKNIDSLYSLCKNSQSESFMSAWVKRKVFFEKENYSSYAATVFSRFSESFNVYGFGAALLILLIWIVYLTKLDFYQRENISPVVFILLLGMLFSFFVSYFSDTLKYTFEFALNGELLNDLVYCVVGIGLVEELMKIVPFLLLLRFTKIIKEPIDYIIYASVSALGFAFVENIFYFGYSGFHKILGRALSAVIFHMFLSSVLAYSLVLGKNIAKYNVVKTFLIALVLVSVFHGLYDFLLINEKLKFLSFLTFFQLLISMFLWSSIINNCLNNSSKFEKSAHYNAKELNDYLLYALSFVFMFEYMVMAIQYGASNANKTLVGDLLQGSFLLVFLTVSLSRFDVIRNYWAPLSFWDWSTFVNMHSLKPQYFNLHEILNRKITLSTFRDNSVLHDILPLNGVIVQRELISWEKDWYLIELEKSIEINSWSTNLVLVKIKDSSSVILSKPLQIVNLRLVLNADLLKEKKKNKRDFPFVDYAVLKAGE